MSANPTNDNFVSLLIFIEHYTYESAKYLDSIVDILDDEIHTEKVLLALNGQINTIVNTSISAD